MQYLYELLGISDPRFPVGAEVVCRTGQGWQPGKVVAHWWTHPDFPPDFYAPYQVELKDGTLIFVPQDKDELCRERKPAWWERLFESGRPTPRQICEAFTATSGAESVDEADHSGATALSESARLNWGDCVGALLALGASANTLDEKGRCPLHHAVMLNQDSADAVGSIVESLLAHGANPNAQDQDEDKDPEYTSRSFQERDKHRAALHYCAVWGYISAAQALLQASADPNMIDGQYKTPLHLAIEERAEAKSMDMVALLLRSKAEADRGNMEIGMSSSYLMVSARKGDEELAVALINARADLNKAGKQDMTPLHVAVRARKENVVKLLINAKCDTTIKAMGNTAGELAAKNKMPVIAKLLGVE